MFERFTDPARRVLVLAQEEALLLDHGLVDAEHLLLGLIHAGDEVAARVLGSCGISLEVARRRVAETIGPAVPSAGGAPPYTAHAKKVLDLAQGEALRLGHTHIGPEHLLLGIISDGHGGAQVLVHLGADPSEVHQRVLQDVAGHGSPPGPSPSAGGWRRVGSGGGRSRPLCPTCRSGLEGNVAYRVLTVDPDDGAAEAEGRPIDVVVVYCRTCGVMLAHTPAGDVDTLPGAEVVVPPSGEGVPAQLRVIADGSHRYGAHPAGVVWTLQAGGTDEAYSTMLRMVDVEGVIDYGGFGGPKLWPGALLNVYTGGNPERGPRAVVVRSDPSITSLRVVREDGTEVAMETVAVDGLRFGVALVAPDARLREVVGSGRDGTPVARFDLHGHDGAWHADGRRGQPGPPG